MYRLRCHLSLTLRYVQCKTEWLQSKSTRSRTISKGKKETRQLELGKKWRETEKGDTWERERERGKNDIIFIITMLRLHTKTACSALGPRAPGRVLATSDKRGVLTCVNHLNLLLGREKMLFGPRRVVHSRFGTNRSYDCSAAKLCSLPPIGWEDH